MPEPRKVFLETSTLESSNPGGLNVRHIDQNGVCAADTEYFTEEQPPAHILGTAESFF